MAEKNQAIGIFIEWMLHILSEKFGMRKQDDF